MADVIRLGIGDVTRPGNGFGRDGIGFIRVRAFNDRDKVVEAMARIERIRDELN